MENSAPSVCPDAFRFLAAATIASSPPGSALLLLLLRARGSPVHTRGRVGVGGLVGCERGKEGEIDLARTSDLQAQPACCHAEAGWSYQHGCCLHAFHSGICHALPCFNSRLAVCVFSTHLHPGLTPQLINLGQVRICVSLLHKASSRGAWQAPIWSS